MKLYVDDSGVRKIFVWDVDGDSVIANKREFAAMATASGNADGMKTDSLGNIFCAGPMGIWVFSPGGNRARHHPRAGADHQLQLGR